MVTPARCAHLECYRVLGVTYLPAMMAKTTGHLPFLGHQTRHAHFTLNQLLQFDMGGNQVIQSLLNGLALRRRV